MTDHSRSPATATLLPCPFCGGDPKISTRWDEDLWTHNSVKWTAVSCSNCDVRFDWPPGAEPDAITRWNTRASQPATPTDAIEAGARAIASSQGHDPDDLAPRTIMCTGDNEQVPWWKVFEEQAEACLAATPTAMENDHRRARSSAGIESKPVAWVSFAGNGNIQFWTANEERAERERESGRDLRMFTLPELVALAAHTPDVAQPAPQRGVYNEIACRRQRQITKGYDATHDDKHSDGSIARGAAAFALAAGGPVFVTADRRRAGMYRGPETMTLQPGSLWPWDSGFNPDSPRDALIDAAAMVVAEIERLDRALAIPSTNGNTQ